MEGKGQKEEDMKAKSAKSCLITWGSSEKHFNCAFSLSKICSVIANLSSDFLADSSPPSDNRRIVVGFHDRVFIRSKANFIAVVFLCILSGFDLKNRTIHCDSVSPTKSKLIRVDLR